MPRVTISAGNLALASVGNNFAQLTYDQPRNGLINGCFEIWQRGTSALPTATGPTNGFAADRWQAYRQAYTSGVTCAQSTGTAQTRYALRIQRTAGNTATNDVLIAQSLETANSEVYAGQQVTFSAWVRRGANFSATSNIAVMKIVQGFGTDQRVASGFTSQSDVASANKTLATVWQRVSVTGTVSTSASQIAVILSYSPTGTAGADDWFEITGAQLEIGATPSTFQIHGGSVASELAACQRYYQRFGGTANMVVAHGAGSGTTVTNVCLNFPSMRIAPTSLGWTGIQMCDATGATTALTNLALTAATTNRATLQMTHVLNDVAHRPYGLQFGASTGWIELNAEM